MKREFTEYFRMITQSTYQRGEEKLDKYGLVKGQANLLILIREHDGYTQKELAELLKVKYSSLSVRLDKLEERGYIARSADENNAKFKRIHMTTSGKMAVVQCRRMKKELEETMYKGFTKRDIKQLEGYLEKICKNLGRIE